MTFAVTHAHIRVRSKADWLRSWLTLPPSTPRNSKLASQVTHQVEDERFELYEVADVDGPTVRVRNPGSATGAGPADGATMMTAELRTVTST